MTANNHTLDPKGFKASWDNLRAMVLEEWPSLDSDKLDATSGDPDKVIKLVAETTEHTRTLVRKQLGELSEAASRASTTMEDRLLRLISRLEDEGERFSDRAREARDHAGKLLEEAQEQGRVVVDRVKEQVPEAEATMKDNLWTSLIAALGIGLILGLLVGLTRGR